MFDFDNSLLSDLAECSAKYIVRHVHGLEARRQMPYGPLGDAFHQALECHFNDGTIDRCLEVFEAAYDHVIPPGEGPPMDMMARENLTTILTQFCLQRPVSSWPFEVLELEEMVSWELAPGMMFWAKRDMLVRDAQMGHKFPVDHKTRWGQINEWWTKKFRMISQFTGYIWITEKLTGEPCNQILVNAISCVKLPDSNRRCSKHGCKFVECREQHVDFQPLKYTRSPEQLAKWEQDALGLARKAEMLAKAYEVIEALPFAERNGTFNGGCVFCEFAEWCKSGFDPDVRGEFVRENRWEPWAEGEGGGYDYDWYYSPADGTIFPAPVTGAVQGLTNTPRAMALKKLWGTGGGPAWMQVWESYKFAQEEMSAWARKETGYVGD